MMQSTHILQSVAHNDHNYHHLNHYDTSPLNPFQEEININNRRMNLLDQYAKCLEKENKAKSTEIQVLHQQLNRVSTENEHLRTTIRSFQQSSQPKNMNKTAQNSFNYKHSSVQCQNACIQTTNNHQAQLNDKIKEKLNQLNVQMQERDEQMQRYHKEGEEMFIIIQQLQKQLKGQAQTNSQQKETIHSLQSTLSAKLHQVTTLTQHLANIHQHETKQHPKNSISPANNQQLQAQLSQLISRNIQLIQTNRTLQKQKNEYYHQVKRMSRISFGKQNLSKSNLKNSKIRDIKDQRFRQIEQHLRKIKMQNKQLEANFMIA